MNDWSLLLCFSVSVLLCLPVQTYENLALHKTTWQSTTNRFSNGPDRAVDGLKTNLSWRGGQCTASRDYQTTSEWRVDLGGILNIHHILLYFMTGNDISDEDSFYAPFLLGFSMYMSNTSNKEDGVLCFKDNMYTRATIPNPVNINCPYHGRYVIYYNNRTHPPYPDGYSEYAMNTLCEVEVYGCFTSERYGENCSIPCPENCFCHIVEGSCLSCFPGYKSSRCNKDCDGKTYGFGCKENCGKCRGGAQCNHVTGTCQNGCDPGVYGDRCDKECPDGLYGNDCAENCSMSCRDPRKCDKITGYCLGNCQAGWTGNKCEKECPDGLFGFNCEKNCSITCDIGGCDKITGHCINNCQIGWTGEMCENECQRGFYGYKCKETCSMTCGNPGICDRITGNCSGGCRAGWTGLLCDEDTPSKSVTCATRVPIPVVPC